MGMVFGEGLKEALSEHDVLGEDDGDKTGAPVADEAEEVGEGVVELGLADDCERDDAAWLGQDASEGDFEMRAYMAVARIEKK